MAKIRVLIVEDSLTVRRRLIDVLEAEPDVEVAGVAEDGRTAIELCRTLRPDVVTLDMILPVMSGLAVTEYVMAHFPTPILVVSASTNRGELYKTYEALSAGAVDVLIGNAWKFTQKAEAPRIAVGAEPRGPKQTAFYVRDHGAGFDMRYVERLFGPFQRLHEPVEFPGTGVGLATVHRIVDRHGGRVSAEGAIGNGATFCFILPVP